MRIALVSDIHGNLAALEAVAADIRLRGADAVVNLGDHLSGPLLPRETAQFLMASGWLCIAGNHERQLLACADKPGGASDQYAYSQLGAAELAWVRSLPATHMFHHDMLLCHGTPHSDCTYLLETVHHGHMVLADAQDIAQRLGGEGLGNANAAIIACGHTHVPRSVRLANGQHIINPGSVGLQAYTDGHPQFHRMHTGSPDARYALLEKTAQGWQVELRTVPYQHAAMAQLARRRGQRDWEVALLTGRNLA